MGKLDYAAGTLNNFPSGTMTLATIEFRVLKEVPRSTLEFQFAAPRLTDVTFGGASVLTRHQNGVVITQPGKIYLPLVVR